MSTTKLSDIIEEIQDNSKRSISVGDVVETLNHRGFGAVLIVPALIIIMPTGMIPGVPAVCSLFICFLTGQIIIGRRYLWLPHKLAKLSLRKKKLEAAFHSAREHIEKIDAMTHPRLKFLVQRPAQIFIALLCFILGALITMIGFIPYMPALLAVPILFFALGVTAKDGVLTLIGFSFVFISFAALPFLLSLVSE